MSKAQELKPELLPCPFCGSKAKMSHSRDGEVCNVRCSGWSVGSCLGAGPNCYTEAEAISAWNNRPASSEQQAAPRVQWWLATIDMHGNPTLTDGAHGDRAGADRAAYLIDALGVGQGKNYAVARVELSEPKPNADGVSQEAVDQCNLAARASTGGTE